MPAPLVPALQSIVGPDRVLTDAASLDAYGHDALDLVHRPSVVVVPATAEQVSAVARLCDGTRTPLVPRGAGTGYTGGAVPVRGGVLLGSYLSALPAWRLLDPLPVLARPGEDEDDDEEDALDALSVAPADPLRGIA